MIRLRIAAQAIVLVLTALSVGAARAAPTPSARTVPCDEIILTAKSGVQGAYRVVLGVVSVPPAYLEQVVATPGQPWPYWRKAGLVIRGGAGPVNVSVPKAWRSRVAIIWGYRYHDNGYSALRLARCPPSESKPWNAYSGGFYLRSRSACVPLNFRVGQRSRIVRFGIGRRCGATSGLIGSSGGALNSARVRTRTTWHVRPSAWKSRDSARRR